MEDHSPESLTRARRLRQNVSLPERLLWRELRGKPLGVKFRKQPPVGEFVIDFYRTATRTAVEIDGKAHDVGDRPARDAAKDQWLAENGVQVMRVPATDVLQDVTATAEAIMTFCKASPPLSAAYAVATSPSGGGFSESPA
jgi:very-short-patch-repair endonuclease